MPTQYHPPVAPIVPEQRMIAPELIANAGNAGLNGFIQMNANRQRALLEEKALQQRAVLQEQEFGLQREKMAADFQLEERRLGVTAAHYLTMANREGRGMIDRAAKDFAYQQTIDNFQADLEQAGLRDPGMTDPTKFYAGAQDVKNRWRWNPLPEIKQGLRALDQIIATDHSMPLKVGEDGGTRHVPVGKIARDLKNPATFEATMKMLERNNLVRYEAADPNDPKSPTMLKMDEIVQKWIKTGNVTDWATRGPTRREMMDPRRFARSSGSDDPNVAQAREVLAREAGITGTGDPNDEAELPVTEDSLYPKSETDEILAEARAMIPRKGRAAIEAMLRDQ